jgi:hypothetical protein
MPRNIWSGAISFGLVTSLKLGPVRPEAFDLQLSETESVVPEASQ